NRSFIDSKTFDGFRKTVQREFDEIYIIDTKSDVRQNPKIAGTTHNIFGIQTGVAITFLVKKDSPTNQEKNAKIFYYTLTDEMRKEEKLIFLRENELNTIPFERIHPDEQGNWINLSNSDFQNLIPLCNKEVKLNKNEQNDNAVFKLFSLGVVTARDEWVYDFNKQRLKSKVQFLIDKYNQEVKRLKGIDKAEVKDKIEYSIKWTRAVKNDLAKGKIYDFDEQNITTSLYRPFVKKYLYYAKELNEMQYQMPKVFGNRNQFQNKVSSRSKFNNKIICFVNVGNSKSFHTLASSNIVDLHFTGDSQCLPLYYYDKLGNCKDNITDWALNLFQNYYAKSNDRTISKEDIFHYVYAVLHKPEYRAKYALDLKRNLPRIPLYADFWHYATIGKELMNLHLTYDSINADFVAQQLGISVERKARKAVEPKRNTTNADTNTQSETTALKNKLLQTEVKLRLKDKQIEIDEWTTLRPIPDEVYEYKLGNRTAVEWVLEQYKPYKSSDATIQEKFNTYNFYDYKEQVIELLLQVIYVSVQTVKLVRSL
ncbi:MAG: hypothetical protein NZ551_09535, partial [Microscillaceae bacterium]|nr:hypothetical protein [Microscillaceae bacterium]MDW8461442.1 type ISP restriction/modification enzyme [Cytophagales bacterium]